MKELNADFKQKRFKPIYLLYGDESFLIRHYEQQFEQLVSDPDMNRSVFEGKDCDVQDIINAADTLPFFSEYRLVYIKNSGLIAAGRKEATEKLTAGLAGLSESTIVIFAETAVDKRNRLYKRIAERGRAVELKSPSEGDLVRWLNNIFKKKNSTIEPAAVRYLITTAPHGMDALYKEADKLADYAGSRTITVRDAEALCTKSLEAKIFELVAAVCQKNTAKALVQYRNMLVMKESPLMILAMLARQFRLILQCKLCAEQNMNPGAISASLGLRDFMVREFLAQSRRFSTETLKAALHSCQDTDTDIKTGRIGDALGVELLIIEYGTAPVPVNTGGAAA